MKDVLFNDIYNKSIEILKNSQDEEIIATLYTDYCKELEKIDALSNENKNVLLKALIRAKMSIKEKEIYELTNELEAIRKEIKKKENELYECTSSSFELLSKVVQNDIQKDFLEELMLNEANSLKILYETSQNAFISVLESATMIEERSYLISNYMIINSLEFANFDKAKILNAADLILKAALDLVNEWQSYAQELLQGVLNGLLDGIFKVLERLKKDLETKLSNDELENLQNALVNLESDFINMIKLNVRNDVAGETLTDILNNQLNNNFSKLARLVRENKQLLNIKFINFQNSELNHKLEQKLNHLEKEAKKAYNDFDAKKLAQNLISKFKKDQNDN